MKSRSCDHKLLKGLITIYYYYALTKMFMVTEDLDKFEVFKY